MAWHSLRNEAEIKRILDFIIQRGTDIEVHIPGDEETYFSRFLKALPVTRGGFHETWGNGLQLALEDLSPRIGNHRVRTSPEVEIYFSFSRFLCRFRSDLVSGSNMTAHRPVLIGYPGIMEMKEKRKEERLYPGSPDFLSAVFTFEGKNHGGRKYDLNVLNYSNNGLGLLVEEEDSSLLAELEPGDVISGILLFGEALLVKISAVVRHKSEIHEGPYSGSFIVGLESEDGLEQHLDHLATSKSTAQDAGGESLLSVSERGDWRVRP